MSFKRERQKRHQLRSSGTNIYTSEVNTLVAQKTNMYVCYEKLFGAIQTIGKSDNEQRNGFVSLKRTSPRMGLSRSNRPNENIIPKTPILKCSGVLSSIHELCIMISIPNLSVIESKGM